MEKQPKHLAAIARGFAIVASFATLVLMVALCVDVVSRLTVNRSLPGMIELSETCLVFIVFCGMAYACLQRTHISVDILSYAVSPRIRLGMRVIVGFLTTIFLAWAVYATGSRSISSFLTGEYKFGLLEWPVWPSRWAITAGFTLALIVTVTLLSSDVRSLWRGKGIGHGR